MYDTELAIELLNQVSQAAQTILKRFEPIHSVGDFLDSEEEMS